MFLRTVVCISTVLMVLCLVPVFCAGQTQLNDTTVVFQQNKVVLHRTARFDVDTLTDPVTGYVTVRKHIIYEPILINGIPIRKESVPFHVSKKLQQKIVTKLVHDLNSKSIPDGKIWIRLRNIVVSQKDTLAYYELNDIRIATNDGRLRKLDENLLSKQMITDAIMALSYQPREKYLMLNMDLSRSYFIKTNGKVTFVP